MSSNADEEFSTFQLLLAEVCLSSVLLVREHH